MGSEFGQTLLNKALKGDDEALRDIYTTHREEFLAFSKKFKVEESEAKDVYQEAILVLMQNLKSGKLVELNSSVKTYLFSIGKYMFFERGRKKGKVVYKEEIEEQVNVEHLTLSIDQPLSAEQELLKKYFRKLGTRCKEVLTFFYYRGYDIEEIAIALGYDNKNVVKSQKSRCLRQLKDLIKKNDVH